MEYGTVTIAEEAETVPERIVIYRLPVAADKRGNQQEQSALGLMKIGNQSLHDAETESRNYDYAGAGDKFGETVVFEI